MTHGGHSGCRKAAALAGRALSSVLNQQHRAKPWELMPLEPLPSTPLSKADSLLPQTQDILLLVPVPVLHMHAVICRQLAKAMHVPSRCSHSPKAQALDGPDLGLTFFCPSWPLLAATVRTHVHHIHNAQTQTVIRIASHCCGTREHRL